MSGHPVAKVLCIGEEWLGSNASGLFHSLSRVGCLTSIVNELKYISVQAKSLPAKVLNRAIRPFQIDDFNCQISVIAKSFRPDMILIYKGAYIKPQTIEYWRHLGIKVVNFFPDVSFLAHGKLIPSCIPLYDHIFTTKTFAAFDLARNFGYDQKKVTFIPHGFDPLIHRPIKGYQDKNFECDASFIGSYSPHKEKYLSALKSRIPKIRLKIWGGGWHRAANTTLKGCIEGITVSGYLYALALTSSKINIALLSEKVDGATRGDQITSRTFHIPACGGFMLHQRTDEVKQYFEEGEEMTCFESPEELAHKVEFYMINDQEREKIKAKGFDRAVRDHSLDSRAVQVLNVLRDQKLIR